MQPGMASGWIIPLLSHLPHSVDHRLLLPLPLRIQPSRYPARYSVFTIIIVVRFLFISLSLSLSLSLSRSLALDLSLCFVLTNNHIFARSLSLSLSLSLSVSFIRARTKNRSDNRLSIATTNILCPLMLCTRLPLF